MELNAIKYYNLATASSPVNLNLASDAYAYFFSGTVSLAGGFTVSTTGTPVDGMSIVIWWDGTSVTLNGNTVTIMGVTLDARQAVRKLLAISMYHGSAGAWKTRFFLDGSSSAWITGGDIGTTAYDGSTINNGASGLEVKTGGLTNTQLNASANIALSKLAALTASRLAITDGSGVLSAADTATYPSLAELAHLKGV